MIIENNKVVIGDQNAFLSYHVGIVCGYNWWIVTRSYLTSFPFLIARSTILHILSTSILIETARLSNCPTANAIMCTLFLERLK